MIVSPTRFSDCWRRVFDPGGAALAGLQSASTPLNAIVLAMLEGQIASLVPLGFCSRRDFS